MKYFLMICENEAAWNRLPAAEHDAIVERYSALEQEMQQASVLLGGHRLQPVAAATSVRVRHGRVTATDGPFAETKEQFGGYFLIEAKDLDEALRWAAKIPGAETGTLEVRPVWEYPAA